MMGQIPEIGRSVPGRMRRRRSPARRVAADYYGDDLLWPVSGGPGSPRPILASIPRRRRPPGRRRRLTGRDVPGNQPAGIIHKDQPVLCTGKVRHCGDAVALVVAEDPTTLAKALGSSGSDIDPLPGVFGDRRRPRTGRTPRHEENTDGNSSCRRRSGRAAQSRRSRLRHRDRRNL